MIIITTGEEEEEEEGWMGSDDDVISQFQSEGVFRKGRDERERACVLSLFFTSASPKIQPQSKSKN